MQGTVVALALAPLPLQQQRVVSIVLFVLTNKETMQLLLLLSFTDMSMLKLVRTIELMHLKHGDYYGFYLLKLCVHLAVSLAKHN
jgi:hypothetical protein